jgi:hypothetical protein
MGRARLVLAAAAVMVAMLVAFSAPVLADDGRNHNGNNNHTGWNNWDNNWNNWDNNWNNHNRFDPFDNDRSFSNHGFGDDCEWEFEEGWFLGFWGWQWGTWFLDC